jgi:hypothetical protein
MWADRSNERTGLLFHCFALLLMALVYGSNDRGQKFGFLVGPMRIDVMSMM